MFTKFNIPFTRHFSFHAPFFFSNVPYQSPSLLATWHYLKGTSKKEEWKGRKTWPFNLHRPRTEDVTGKKRVTGMRKREHTT